MLRAWKKPSGDGSLLPSNGISDTHGSALCGGGIRPTSSLFSSFQTEIRKIIYTTNAIESLNLRLRKAIRTRVAFLSEEAVLKVMYLASRNLAKKWTAVHGWKYALNCFSIMWEARFPHNGL